MTELEMPVCELIGLETKISNSENKQLVGLSGKTILETKNTLIMKTEKGDKQIPKSICEFVFTSNKKEIKINGTSLLKKPYERLESLSWHKI